MNETPKLWITVFEEDSAFLVSVPSGDVTLPKLSAPFRVGDVKVACAEGGVEARIIVGLPDQREARQLRRVRLARAAEQKARESFTAAVQRTSVAVEVRSWAEALERKNAIDDELRRVKAELGQARSRVFTSGQYADPSWYRGTESRAEKLKLESQALQQRLGELRRKEQKNLRSIADETAHAFVRFAKNYLEEDEFNELLEEAKSFALEKGAPE